jgi:hypothetical protein
MRFFRNEEVEQIAEKRLAEFASVLERPLTLPIPIDLLAERLFDLSFLWEPITELPGEVIFGAIIPEKSLILLNESRMKDFRATAGLERSTMGHEIGHWDLFIKKSLLNHPQLFEGIDERIEYRSAPSGNASVFRRMTSSQAGREYLNKILDRADEPDEARAVNRYAAALSMPREIVIAEAKKIDRTKWPNLYKMARQFDVSITALKVRLCQLNLLHVDEDGTLYESPDAARGQYTLDF